MRLNLSYDAEDEVLQLRIPFLESRLYAARTMVPQGFERFFQESARYTSVHTSTAIEGNTLDYDAAMVVLVEGADEDQPLEVEKVNLDEAYELMASLVEDKTTKIDQGIIRTMNSIVLKGLPDAKARNRGKFRVGPSLIVSASTGEVRYRPPPPQWVPELMDNFVDDVNRWMRECPGPVAAALAHFGLISIHPFDDGNGRTARLVADMILNLTGFAADGMIAVSEVFHDNLTGYYDALRESQGDEFKEEVDVTPFVRFHTEALASAAVMLEEHAIRFRRGQDEFARRVDGVLNERQVIGLMFMAGIGAVSTSYYARLTKSSQATALSDLNVLVEKRLVDREGAGKSTRYRIHPKAQGEDERQ
ncbi:MAG: Fic family protein [Dehalococcoidia bacterium]|nr:Fic family protein [Dehalococcoidia bacterium]